MFPSLDLSGGILVNRFREPTVHQPPLRHEGYYGWRSLSYSRNPRTVDAKHTTKGRAMPGQPHRSNHAHLAPIPNHMAANNQEYVLLRRANIIPTATKPIAVPSTQSMALHPHSVCAYLVRLGSKHKLHAPCRGDVGSLHAQPAQFFTLKPLSTGFW